MDGLSRTQRAAQDLIGPVGDHLVRVGVGGGSRTSLKDIDDEVLVESSLLDFFGCLLNRICETRLEEAELAVDERRGALDLGQRSDETAWQPEVADGKIPAGSFGARPVIGAFGNGELAHRITLHPGSLL